MTLGSKWFFREGGLTLAVSLMASLAANLHHASAEPATDEDAKVVPAASISFSELQRVIGALPEGDESPARLVDEWLADRDLSELSIEDVRWCLVQSLPNEQDRHAFTVTWTGMLKAPRAGSYVFSVSPINVNSVGRESVRHSLKVTVGQDVALNTSPARQEPKVQITNDRRSLNAAPLMPEWHWKGAPVELQADRAVPVQVVLEYEGPAADKSNSPSAILFWQGPGLERQPVGESFFSGPDGGPGGLKAEYAWKDSQGSPQAVVQQSPSIDYAWTSAARVAPTRPKLVAQLADRLWLLATDPKYLEKCEAGSGEHVYFQDYASTDYLSTARRQQFLELLVERPELLAKADDEDVLRLYRKLRFGAEDAALEMLGHWMQLHADQAPEIAADFFPANRAVYWGLAEHLARQLPGQYQVLRDRYLEMDDGRCALPTAYTVAYAQLLEERLPRSVDEGGEVLGINEWISYLSDALSEESLQGDLRLNWLLARAQAEEARLSTGRPDLAAGKGWLDEASLVVENDEARLRVAQERLARLAAMRMWPEASAELETISGAPETWKDQLLHLEQQQASAARQEATNARLAQVRDFERRRQKASDRGDAIAEARYAERLTQLETPPD